MLHDVFRIQVFRQNNTEQNSILSKVHSSKKLHILKRVKATRNPVREAQRLDAIDYFNLLPDIKRIITYLWWRLCGGKKKKSIPPFLYDTSLVGKKILELRRTALQLNGSATLDFVMALYYYPVYLK